MKKHEIIFSLLKIPLDFMIVFFSFFIAKNLRELWDFIPWFDFWIQTISFDFLFKFAFLAWCIYIFIFFLHWLYNLKVSSSKIKEFLDIIIYSFYSFLIFSLIVFFTRWIFYEFDLPRLLIIYAFFIGLFWIILWRIILNKLQFFLLNKNYLQKRNILIITNTNSITDILNDINISWIYNIVWYINKTKVNDLDLKYLWTDLNIEKTFSINKVDEILFINSDFSEKELYDIWDISRIYAIRYRYITNNFDFNKTNTLVSLISKIPVIEISPTPLDAWKRVLKRIFDIISSFFLIIFFLPFFIIIWILIKIEDPSWPIIYKNLRVWQKWKLFNLYKFRYLKWQYCIKESYWIKNEDDEALNYEKELINTNSTRNWPLYKIKNDPRKTKIWKIIEKYSIDELPQLLNVFLWNMSLTWPRPHQPREVEKYSLYQKRVLSIKPWITWLAQVNWREKNDFDEEVRLDVFYIENWSFLLDLKILLKTISVVLNRK